MAGTGKSQLENRARIAYPRRGRARRRGRWLPGLHGPGFVERIFLSYTYNPHPDAAGVTDRLQRAARVVIESLGLRVLDGVDLGGRAIDAEIERRIGEADALVAILTPQPDPAGNAAPPPYVENEYQLARDRGKEAIRVLQEGLPVRGMGQQEEYIPLHAGDELSAVLKLMRTVALWKHRSGRPMRVEIEPSELGGRYRNDAFGHLCQYQVFTNYAYSDWHPATIWAEPGATFVYLLQVPDDAKIKLRLALDGEQWESPFCSPTGRLRLSRRAP